MPARGDIQRQAHQIPNPYDEEPPPRMQEYTAREIATLQSRLEKQLGPEYISSRKGPGGQTVHYLGAEKIINLANEVFGFNGWSTSIRDTTIDYVDIGADQKVSMGLSVIMRVTLKDGTYHEDVGYGVIANCSGKGAAFEKTKKEAATDAMKRALRNFGNVLGNCLYDKDYLKKVVKIKPPPSKWHEDNLYRHQDVMPGAHPHPGMIPEGVATPTEKATASMPPTRNASAPSRAPSRNLSAQSKTSGMTTDYDDEFGGNAFDDVDFTRSDEFVVPEGEMMEDVSMVPNPAARPGPQRAQSVPQGRPQPQAAQRPPAPQPQAPPPQARPPVQQRPTAPQNAGYTAAQAPQRPAAPQPNTGAGQGQQAQSSNGQQRTTSSTPEIVQQRQNMQAPQNAGPTQGQSMPEVSMGFVRGRLADVMQSANAQIPANALFNPHAESPSIRKTTGVNHRASGPVRREDIGLPAAPEPTGPAANLSRTTGFSAPQMNQNSFAPPQMAPPQQNGNLPHVSRTTNFINPQLDQTRRIGAPVGGMQSPVPRGAGAYKPPGPTVGQKRGPPDHGATPMQRPPLSDVSSNIKPAAPVDAGGGDAKRMRVQGQGPGMGQEGNAVAS